MKTKILVRNKKYFLHPFGLKYFFNLFLWFLSNYFCLKDLLLLLEVTNSITKNILVKKTMVMIKFLVSFIPVNFCFPFDLNCTLSLEIWLSVNFVTGKPQKLTWHVWYWVLVLTADVENFSEYQSFSHNYEKVRTNLEWCRVQISVYNRQKLLLFITKCQHVF